MVKTPVEFFRPTPNSELNFRNGKNQKFKEEPKLTSRNANKEEGGKESRRG